MKIENISDIKQENIRLKQIVENLEEQNRTLLHYIYLFEILDKIIKEKI